MTQSIYNENLFESICDIILLCRFFFELCTVCPLRRLEIYCLFIDCSLGFIYYHSILFTIQFVVMKQIVLLLLYFLGALVPLQAQLAKIDQRKLIDGGLDGKNYAMIVGNSSNLKAQISLQAMQESKSKTTELLKELGLLAETKKNNKLCQ